MKLNGLRFNLTTCDAFLCDNLWHLVTLIIQQTSLYNGYVTPCTNYTKCTLGGGVPSPLIASPVAAVAFAAHGSPRSAGHCGAAGPACCTAEGSQRVPEASGGHGTNGFWRGGWQPPAPARIPNGSPVTCRNIAGTDEWLATLGLTYQWHPLTKWSDPSCGFVLPTFVSECTVPWPSEP
jgi:hypothetical protein